MIPGAYVQEWSGTTPWPDPRQVEQDLIICRALCDIFDDPWLSERLAFRGGTAMNELLFAHPLRYSEDIDLVQVRPEANGVRGYPFGTKLRALLQRHKSRDLFDLNEGLVQLSLDAEKIVAAFGHYLSHDGHQISRANAEERMLAKLTRTLTDDIVPLLAADVVYGAAEAQMAFERVWFRLIARLDGSPWHRSEPVIDELRATSLPTLLRSPNV